ncbi:acetate/propionate family kinase [Luteolibacter ambystomatis]
MRIIAVNAGSGSLKVSLFEVVPQDSMAEPREPLWTALLDTTAPDQPPDELLVSLDAGGISSRLGSISKDTPAETRIRGMLALMTRDSTLGGKPDAVVHRVVHGGERYTEAVRMTEEVEAGIDRLCAFAPLHNPVNLAGIRVAKEIFGDIPHVAVFDTAFHQRMPRYAATYAGPREWFERGIRRYGFHGTSFRWAAEYGAALLGRKNDPGLCLVICHLGGGCSLCATVGGWSIDTTMGFTPLDGIAMCTRSGSVDPGILIHLLREGMDTDELEELLNRQSGLLGLSGISGDTRVLIPLAEHGNEDARLAIGVFRHRLRRGIGGMLGSMGRTPDALIFTDVIGESAPSIRAAACEAFGFLGLRLDREANEAGSADREISCAESSGRVLVVRSREDWQMVRECAALLGDPEKSL